MTAKKGLEGKWRQTTVLLRDDILTQAQAAGLDITDICNRALAGATGIRYPRKETGEAAPAAPVIIAQNGASAAGASIPPPGLPEVPPPAPGIHPVINADDPRAAVTVKQAPKPPVHKAPAALPGRVSAVEKPGEVPAAPAVPPREKPAKPAPARGKKGKGPAIRSFVDEAITREDAEESRVTKVAMYETFTRWCREHRIMDIPDRKAVTVALKNQFALKEKTVDGEPSWVNVRLK
jgi:hypothetical protein